MEGLLTPFGEKLDRAAPLADYPRPQLVRGSFFSLNGPWQYAINRHSRPPGAWDGEIVVPFSPESPLSGVGRTLRPSETLWYRKTFVLPEDFNIGRVLLHFGAVDQCCVLWFNGHEVGGHDGGFLPFTVELSALLAPGENELVLSVIDETDEAPYARGGQKLAHGGRWHAPMSGIWQTVWLESVPRNYVRELRITPVYGERCVEFQFLAAEEPMEALVEIFDGRTLCARGRCPAGGRMRLPLPHMKSWSPEDPFLYTVRLRAGEDVLVSYFGMREFRVGRDAGGKSRFFLNGKPYFLCGVLDQGLYSDGLYTPPSDEAMLQDLEYAKACGFNAVRKLGKIEPLRWYYACDRLGLLVWQDLPGGCEKSEGIMGKLLRRGGRDDRRHKLSTEERERRASYRRDMAGAARLLYNTPSLSTWVLFDEGYGQFSAARHAARMTALDATRLVDHASGWHDQGAGDFASLHADGCRMPPMPGREEHRAIVLSDMGDIGLLVPEHFSGANPAAAQLAPDAAALQSQLGRLCEKTLPSLVRAGLSGVFYRQLSDAQCEVSGLLTCDRRRQKVPAAFVAALNRTLRRVAGG